MPEQSFYVGGGIVLTSVALWFTGLAAVIAGLALGVGLGVLVASADTGAAELEDDARAVES